MSNISAVVGANIKCVKPWCHGSPITATLTFLIPISRLTFSSRAHSYRAAPLAITLSRSCPMALFLSHMHSFHSRCFSAWFFLPADSLLYYSSRSMCTSSPLPLFPMLIISLRSSLTYFDLCSFSPMSPTPSPTPGNTLYLST